VLDRHAACSILSPGAPMATLTLRTGVHMRNVAFVGVARERRCRECETTS
jgi:hypothetical protein